MKISVIYPSRGRPELCRKTLKKWMSYAKYPENIEWILSIDQDDPSLRDYVSWYEPGNFNLEISRNRSCVDAINVAAVMSTGDLLVVISDDFSPADWWDFQLIDALNNTWFGLDFIAKTNDGLQPTLITLPILGRKYYERFGYVYFPEYAHMFCDQEMTAVGHMLGKVIDLNIPFEHLHYSTGKSPKDAVSERNDSTWIQGETLFNERLKTNFGIPENEIVKPYSSIQWR